MKRINWRSVSSEKGVWACDICGILVIDGGEVKHGQWHTQVEEDRALAFQVKTHLDRLNKMLHRIEGVSLADLVGHDSFEENSA